MEERRIETIEYRLGGDVIETEPMIYRRLYAVGQGLVINRIRYRVKSVDVADGVQRVVLVEEP